MCGPSPKYGVYEFVFYNDKILNTILVCVDERIPTIPTNATACSFACSVDGGALPLPWAIETLRQSNLTIR